jgi:hypothetical protein
LGLLDSSRSSPLASQAEARENARVFSATPFAAAKEQKSPDVSEEREGRAGGQMDEWMDGDVDGCMEGWMDGETMDGRMETRWMDAWMDGETMDACLDGWRRGRMDG